MSAGQGDQGAKYSVYGMKDYILCLDDHRPLYVVFHCGLNQHHETVKSWGVGA